MTGLSYMSRWGVPRTKPPYLLEGSGPPPTKPVIKACPYLSDHSLIEIGVLNVVIENPLIQKYLSPKLLWGKTNIRPKGFVFGANSLRAYFILKNVSCPLTGRKPPHPGLFSGGPRCWARSSSIAANKVQLVYFRLNWEWV
jgi:hypothetical protein